MLGFSFLDNGIVVLLHETISSNLSNNCGVKKYIYSILFPKAVVKTIVMPGFKLELMLPVRFEYIT